MNISIGTGTSAGMEFLGYVQDAFGLQQTGQDLGVLQMTARACLVYVCSVLIFKSAKKRLMGQNSAFDIVMLVILGSAISRAINGSAPLLPTLAAAVALVLLHRFTSWLGFRSQRFARFVEGQATPLVRDGVVDWNEMRRHGITEQDLQSAVRLAIHGATLADAKDVHLEASGKLSVVRKPR
jgi:uncharacterized membrane protein YcaP (DUF421 family)